MLANLENVAVATGQEKVSFHYHSKERQSQRIFKLPHNCTLLTCSKFSKPGFNSTWTVNFQMLKLDLIKAEEQDLKLPKSAGSWKKQESSRKTSISALLTMPKPLTVWITKNCGKFLKRSEKTDHLTCLLRNLYAGQEAKVRTGRATTD